jgi:hypothetical protein
MTIMGVTTEKRGIAVARHRRAGCQVHLVGFLVRFHKALTMVRDPAGS